MFSMIPIFNLKATGRHLLKWLLNKWPMPTQPREKVEFPLFSLAVKSTRKIFCPYMTVETLFT